MKSELNFYIQYNNGEIVDMHEDLGLWVSSFQIASPNASHKLTEVSGMDGAYKAYTKMKTRGINISFQVNESSLLDLDVLKHKVFSTFYSKEIYKIVRDIKPDQEIYAIQDGNYEFDYISDSDAEFDIGLIMPDPYIYSIEKSQVVNSYADPTITLRTTFASSEAPIVNGKTNTDIPFKAEIDIHENTNEIIVQHDQSGKQIRLLFNFVANDKVTILSNWRSDNGHSIRKILLNDERKMNILDVKSSEFFWLNSGQNTFTITPDAKTETKILYKERWI